ncbi:MAG TPA: hypothetical protein VJY62_02870 [Bacteroidia bacterium]|nr:hypothetical protein [Bacteroidia bacterium]
METYAKKKGFTYALYKAFFRPVSDLNKKKSKRLKIPSYETFEGKIIRTIYIHTYDPFGYDIYDTLKKADNFWTKAGNKLHLKTSRFAIRNQLLFHEGDTLDEFKIKESERLLRTSPYLKDVVIYPVKSGSDSLDIYIREIDVWTTIIKLTSAGNDTKIQLIEKDFFGTGHQLDNSIRLVPNNNNIYEGIYTIPNFKNTFITTTIYYKADFDSIFYNGISINRPFYSPLTKWAGGFAFSNITTSDTLFYTDVIKTIPNVKYNQYDVWAGKSWKLFKNYSEVSRITNLVLTTRYLNTDYLSNPVAGTDTLGLLSDEKFYLAGLGVSQRIYIKDKFIFKFGLPEDVPTGQVLSFTLGRQNKGFFNRTYFGARIGWGNYMEGIGYLAANVEYGTFKNNSRLERGVFSADITYFTNLLEIGKWKLRQFIKPRLTLGIERFPTDVLTVNEENGIQGFNSAVLYGTKRLVFSTQTQLYAPYSFIGFRFAPILYFTGALLAADNQNLFKSRFYSTIGFGILFRNELLVLNTFQLAIAFYPVIPGSGNDLLKLNSLKSYDFQFRDFDLQKPATVTFQ